MAAYVNHITLMGNLGRDPVNVSKNPDNYMVKTAIAVSEFKRKEDGETQQITDWFNLVVFGNNAKVLLEYCQKGSNILVMGRLRNTAYINKEGEEIKSLEVVVDTLKIIDKKDKQQSEESTSSTKDSYHKKQTTKQKAQAQDFSDDDIPF